MKKPTQYVPYTPPVRLSPGDAVRVARELQEMTPAELAAASGISPRTLSGIEKGRARLNVERAERLAVALKVHPAVLLWPNWRIEQTRERELATGPRVVRKQGGPTKTPRKSRAIVRRP